jgi:light-regulated signal transduction histidine kinase (bacteriophytochrome)
VEVAIADGITVSGDLRLLRIVLENLLGNAWKFTSKKTGARIEFGVTTDSAGRRVCFVRDNGAGFDMAYASQLFGAFRRLHGTDEFPGTGIGLATVQRIILRHGGRVWAEAAVNEGATFYFSTDAGDRELPSGKALSSLAKVVPTTQN